MRARGLATIDGVPAARGKMDPRRRRTLDTLLRTAEQLVEEGAAERVTVEQIAERAGVAVASIYNHFGSKAGLFAAVVDRALELDAGYMDRAYTLGRDPVAQIVAAGEEYLRFYLEHPAFFRMLAFPAGPGRYPAGKEITDR